MIEGPEALPLDPLRLRCTTVTTSQTHPVLTAAGLKPAKQLTTGDTIFDARGNPHPVTILETLPIEEGQRVINFNLDATSSDVDQRLIVSDGIITGGARQLLFFSAVTLRILGRRVKGCPGRLRRCLIRRSSSHKAAARTWRIASAPSGLFQNISVPFTR